MLLKFFRSPFVRYFERYALSRILFSIFFGGR